MQTLDISPELLAYIEHVQAVQQTQTLGPLARWQRSGSHTVLVKHGSFPSNYTLRICLYLGARFHVGLSPDSQPPGCADGSAGLSKLRARFC